MMKMRLGMVGLVLVGVGGCGSAPGEAAVCAPAGTWSVTVSPMAGNDCADAQEVEMGTRVVTVMNGTATITNPAGGSPNGGPLDSSCHLSYVKAVSTPDYVAAGGADWTFSGASLSGTIEANVTMADGSKCVLKQMIAGVRQ